MADAASGSRKRSAATADAEHAESEARRQRTAEDGWEKTEDSGSFLFNAALDLYFDPATEQYFTRDSESQTFTPVVLQTATAATATPTTAADQLSVAPTVSVGSESWTGRKDSNEDRVVEGEFVGALGTLYAVCDGHGGIECVDYIVNSLHKNIMGNYRPRDGTYKPPPPPPDLSAMRELEQALEQRQQVEEMLQAAEAADAAGLREMAAELDSLILLLEEQSHAALGRSETAAQAEADEAASANAAFEQAVSRALRLGCKTTDANFLQIARKRKYQSGSTAILALVHGIAPHDVRLFVANVGDSRAVLCRGGQALALSTDHKPNRKDEEKRIRAAGGSVHEFFGVPRVCHPKHDMKLAVSRAFGDVDLKTPPLVSSEPEIEIARVQEDDEFLVLACDGIFDVLSNQQVVDLARNHPESPQEAATAIVREAMKKGSMDNISAMVIRFPWNEREAAAGETDGKAAAAADGAGGEDAAAGTATSKEEDEDEDVDDMFA